MPFVFRSVRWQRLHLPHCGAVPAGCRRCPAVSASASRSGGLNGPLSLGLSRRAFAWPLSRHRFGPAPACGVRAAAGVSCRRPCLPFLSLCAWFPRPSCGLVASWCVADRLAAGSRSCVFVLSERRRGQQGCRRRKLVCGGTACLSCGRNHPAALGSRGGPPERPREH